MTAPTHERAHYCECWDLEHGPLCRGCSTEPEPPCTCTRIDVDQYDSRGCELCDPRSEYNREQRLEVAE